MQALPMRRAALHVTRAPQAARGGRRGAPMAMAAVQRDDRRQQPAAEQREAADQASLDDPRAVSNASQPSAMQAGLAPSPLPPVTDGGLEAAGPNPLSALLGKLDFSEPISFDGEEKTEYDPLRDGPLRYLGYANELGEAFAAWLFQGGVPLSYAVAISYVLFDTWDKYQKTLADATAKLSSRADVPPEVDRTKLINAIALERGVDTVVWQLIASVAAPGYTIHTIVALVRQLLEQGERSEEVMVGLYHLAAVLGISSDAFLATFNKTIPTAVGLLAIPFIVHPIDAGVHALLNATLRPALRQLICAEAQGAKAGLKICERCRD